MTSPSAWERIEREKLRQRTGGGIAGPVTGPIPAVRPVPDLLPQVKHILVLMMENHSFDNYLGVLGRGEGFPLGDDGRPGTGNPDSAGAMVRSFPAASTVQQDGVPVRSWNASHVQWAGGKMTGFVTAAEQAAPDGDKTAAMAYWTGQDLPGTGRPGPAPCSSGPAASTAATATMSPRPRRGRPTTSPAAAGPPTRPRCAPC
jgi:hypothetical protein